VKIDYITHHGVAEWVNFAEDNSDFLTVRTREKHTGAVSIGTHVFVLKNGEARIPRSSLPDGEYHPRIECAEGVFVAEGFIKNGKSVRPLPLSEERIRKLFSRMRDLEEAYGLLYEKAAQLEEAYRGHDIFNFERKEK
jgi:hypothetical protein